MDFPLPEIGEGVYEAEVVAWQVRPGDVVKRGQTLLEVMTDKATMEVPAPFAGTVTALRCEPGQRIKVGDVLLSYTTADAPAAVAVPSFGASGKVQDAASSERKTTARTAQGNGAPVALKAAPSVRLLARKLGIDLAALHGSGPDGRILVEDITAQVARHAPDGNGSKRLAEPKPDFGKPGTRIKLQGMRRAIAEHMVRAKDLIPAYSYVEECEVTELVRLRNSLREAFSRAGARLTYLPFFVRAVVAALQEVPIVNASLNDDTGEIVLHDRYHIGIAVATPAGLIVPVVHDADKKDFGTLTREIERLTNEARSGRPKVEDLRGGTFTVTSVGNIGGLFSTPIINHPEIAILGLGKIVRRPVYDDNGNLRPADMLYLSMTCDHRVIDGAVCAAFAKAVCRSLTNPAVLLLPEKL